MNDLHMKYFGKTSDGRTARLYKIRSGRLAAEATDFGATLVSYSIFRSENPENVVLGYGSAAEYEKNDGCLGAVVGRCANRIGMSPLSSKEAPYPGFVLNGREYRLAPNEGSHANLHSGPAFFFRRYWFTEGVNQAGDSICFTLFSPDGDQGFPGNMNVRVTYKISDAEGLKITYEAVSDADTVCNFTNHAYFNLNGRENEDLSGHLLQIFADRITVKDDHNVPDGRFMPVAGTDFDFTTQKKISQNYDDNFVLADHKRFDPELSARLTCPRSGLGLDVLTDLPGIQVYTASGIALEAQYFPNAVNIPEFPAAVTRAGEIWRSSTIYKLYEINSMPAYKTN